MLLRNLVCLLSVGVAVVWASSTVVAQEPYTQHQNVVYAEAHGVALVMDVFEPAGKKNGLAIVDVASGSWSSDRGKINDHKRAKFYDIFCERGYTVFAVRPGSVSKFTGLEMLRHLHQGIRWVKEHAADYSIDPDRLGLVGASAGGHLACLATVTGVDTDTAVAATAVFFPPTDMLEFGGKDLDLHKPGRTSQVLGALAFNGRLDGVSDEQIKETLTKLSPALLVTGDEPPFLLIHGDADPVVPLSQSELMVAALKEKNVPVQLIIKPGGAHPWPTIYEEVAQIADWIDGQLKPVATTAAAN